MQVQLEEGVLAAPTLAVGVCGGRVGARGEHADVYPLSLVLNGRAGCVPSDWSRLVFVVSGGGGRGGGKEGERTRTHLISPMRTHPHHLELCSATSPLASRPWRYITTIISFASVRTTPPHLPNPSLRCQRRRSQHAPLPPAAPAPHVVRKGKGKGVLRSNGYEFMWFM